MHCNHTPEAHILLFPNAKDICFYFWFKVSSDLSLYPNLPNPILFNHRFVSKPGHQTRIISWLVSKLLFEQPEIYADFGPKLL